MTKDGRILFETGREIGNRAHFQDMFPVCWVVFNYPVLRRQKFIHTYPSLVSAGLSPQPTP